MGKWQTTGYVGTLLDSWYSMSSLDLEASKKTAVVAHGKNTFCSWVLRKVAWPSASLQPNAMDQPHDVAERKTTCVCVWCVGVAGRKGHE